MAAALPVAEQFAVAAADAVEREPAGCAVAPVGAVPSAAAAVVVAAAAAVVVAAVAAVVAAVVAAAAAVAVVQVVTEHAPAVPAASERAVVVVGPAAWAEAAAAAAAAEAGMTQRPQRRGSHNQTPAGAGFGRGWSCLGAPCSDTPFWPRDF